MFAASKTDSASGGYQISRSLRFNSADTAYLNRTPATATNRRTWTWSAWVKRSALGAIQELFDGYWANNDNGYFWVGFTSADAFEVQLYNSTLRTTTQVFRDPSAWYHLVLAIDTTQATAANRVKVYLNGSEITTFSTNNAPTPNLDTAVNYNGAHYIGTFSGSSNLFNGYMTEINLIDGTQLTPSSFGETDTQTGVWKPKAYSGSYGTNGFYLNFSDNSNTTSTTLGKDYSGNGNNWTPNGFLVSAGVNNDSLVDSPTSYGTDTGVGGEVRGNYATANPIGIRGFTAGFSVSNGNLTISGLNPGGSATGGLPSTIGVSSGKWYSEFTISATSGSATSIGIYGQTSTIYPGYSSDSYAYYQTGQKINNDTFVSYGSSYTTSDVIGVALDMDAGTLVFYKNGTSQGTAYTGLSGTYFFAVGKGGSTQTNTIDCNFGQRPFNYTAPSGFKALCTQNLPTPTIGATTATQAGKFFNTVLYTGNSSTLAVTGVGFQPDWVWGKCRSTALSHRFFDAVRGVTNRLLSNSTAAETTESGVTAFNSDGFTLGSDQGLNFASDTYVAWNWKANGSGSTNTAGSITSTVSANTTSGFSVVTLTYSGAGTVGHGLGVAPQMIIVKRRDSTGNWFIAHTGLTNMSGYYILLDSTGAQGAANWGGSPTSTTFNMSNNLFSSGTYVAYCFAPVAGFSAFGSYTGNGSTDGAFVYLGFRPAYIMIKSTDANGWIVMDSKRNTYNIANTILQPNTSGADSTDSTNYAVDFLSNGFKLRNSASYFNGSGVTLIYAAFAENPFKFSLAR